MPPFTATPPTFTNLKNNVASTLNAALTNNGTTVILSPGTGVNFPVAPFYLSVEFEVMLCSAKAGDSLTVTRGQDGTTAASHVINSIVELRDTAVIIRDAYDGVTSAFGAINTFGTQVGNKTALPADTVYLDTTQELTHKTLDLTNPSKANVIIGNVSPDPAALNYQNILTNGGFDEWSYPPSLTLAAGTPTSGFRSGAFTNGWSAFGYNDSSISVTKDTANVDSGFPSGIDLLVNVSTVQGSDFVGIWQSFDIATNLSPGDLQKVVGNPFSVSARIKAVSGNVQFKFQYTYSDSTGHAINGPVTQVTGGYNTIKFENQIVVPNINVTQINFYLAFQGVGQVAVDNIMLIIGPVATIYRPSFPSMTNDRLAPNVQRANLLTNGGFEIWQRGNGPFTANAQWPGDRWYISLGASSAISVTKQAGGGGALAGGTYTHSALSAISQDLKVSEPGYEVLPSKTLSLSMLVYATVVNAVQVRLFTVGSSANIDVRSTFHPGNSTYQRLTVTATIPADATLINAGILLSASCTFYVGQAMLVVGSVPADYVPSHPADDLARCLRYYEALAGTGGYPLLSGYMNGGGVNVWYGVGFATKKAIIPTVTKNGTWVASNVGQPSILGSNVDGVGLQLTTTAAGGYLSYPNGAGQSLTCEANP